MRVSLQTVAVRLGLNRSTVSRALRHDPSIPKKTRKRIQAACKEMGYRPNSIISELAASRWEGSKAKSGSVMGYIECRSPNQTFGAVSEVFFHQQAELLGYQVQSFHRAEYNSSAKLQRVLRARGITDLILGPVFEEFLTVELDWKKFICVQLLPGLFSMPLHSVVKDPFNNVLLAWKKAVQYGYKRVGIVLLRHRMLLMDDIMRMSAVDACQRHLFPQLEPLPIYHYYTDDWQVKDFAKWCKEHEPDVLIGFSEGVYTGYREELGRELPFICLHLQEDNPMQYSGIPEAAPSCAREAVNLLHFCRRTYQWGIPKERVDHVVEPTWLEGTSLPKTKTDGKDFPERS